MSLRVLLADESTTIKKVMQLALQDFAVEVKAVQAGVDALDVARSFQPDIVFADVLLQKRNGYDVCHDLKNDSALSAIPVVLMWSSFMDLDEKAFAASRADGKLEKPFDVDSLRALIAELVPKTGSSKIANFLRFPASFSEPLEDEESRKRQSPAAPHATPSAGPHSPAPPPALPPTPPPARAPTLAMAPPAAAPPPVAPPSAGASSWNMNSFEEISDFSAPAGDEGVESFAQVKLAPVPLVAPLAPPSAAGEKSDDDVEPWAHQDLARFKVDLAPVEVASEDISLVVNMEDAPSDGSFLLNAEKRPLAPAAAPEANPAPRPEPKASGPRIADDGTPVFELEAGDAEFNLTTFSAPGDDGADLPGLTTEEPGRAPPTFTIDAPSFVTRPEGVNAEVTSAGLALETLTTARSLDSRPAPPSKPTGKPVDKPTDAALDADQLEAMIRSQSQEIIEAVVRRIVPDIASQLIKKELERLLAEQGESGR